MKKTTFALLSTLVIGVSSFSISSANAAILSPRDKVSKEEALAEQLAYLQPSELSLQKYTIKNEIAELNDAEFDGFVYNLVNKNRQNLDDVSDMLEKVGVDFEIEDPSSPLIQPLAIKPTQLTLTAYSTKRTGDSYWRLNTMWTANVQEVYTASLDTVSIEWNPNVGVYYGSSVPSGGPVTAKDGSKASQGIYLFNVEDDSLGFDSYATVYVTKKSSSSLLYGTKYIHTYSTVKTNVGISPSITFEKGGVTGGLTFDISIGTKESKWQIWDDNTLAW